MKFSPIFVVVLCLCGCSQEQVSLTSVSDFYEAFKNTVNLHNYSSREEVSYINVHCDAHADGHRPIVNFDDILLITQDREVNGDCESFVFREFLNGNIQPMNTDSNPETRDVYKGRHEINESRKNMSLYELVRYDTLWTKRGSTQDFDHGYSLALYNYDEKLAAYVENFSVRELPSKTIDFSPMRFFRHYSVEYGDKIGSFKDVSLTERFTFFDLVNNQEFFAVSGNTLETTNRIPFVYNWTFQSVDLRGYAAIPEDEDKVLMDECSASIKLTKDGDYLSQIEFDVKTEKLNDYGVTLGFLNCSVKLSFSKINQTVLNPLTENEIYGK